MSNSFVVHLFAAVAERMRVRVLELTLPAGSTVADARAWLTRFTPDVVDLIDRSAVAVNHEYAADDRVLNPGDELAVIPPVSGG
jgi:molybdopterin converting factor subunit 1